MAIKNRLIGIFILVVFCILAIFSLAGAQSIKDEIEKEAESVFSKEYYAFIIDQNSPFYQRDKYQIFLADIPNLKDYDPNTTEWIVINRFGLCFDNKCVVRAMENIHNWENYPFYSKLKWQWGKGGR